MHERDDLFVELGSSLCVPREEAVDDRRCGLHHRRALLPRLIEVAAKKGGGRRRRRGRFVRARDLTLLR